MLCAGGENRLPSLQNIVALLLVLQSRSPDTHILAVALLGYVRSFRFSTKSKAVCFSPPAVAPLRCALCGWGESNSQLNLGRVVCYHYTTPALFYLPSCDSTISICFIILRRRRADCPSLPSDKTRRWAVPYFSLPLRILLLFLRLSI